MKQGIPYFISTKKGMTLAEVIIVVAILALISGTIGLFQYNVLSYNRSIGTFLTNAQEAQSILRVMAREMRSMEVGSNGAYPIAAAATSSITFFSDIDGDTVKEQLRYYVSSTSLYRSVVKASGSPLGYSGSESRTTLVTGIRNVASNPVFQYYDSAYAGTTTAMTYPLTITSIRSVKINLMVDSDPNKSPIPRVFSTQASLRNLKDNL